ncbi:MAG: matrixin family metalloprotease [Pyrinomonadaceae bacterium]
MQQYRVEARCIAFLVVLLFSCPAIFASEQPYPPKDSRWRNPRITLSLSRSLNAASNIQADLPQVVGRSLIAWSNPTTITFETVESDAQSVSPKGNRGDGISLITAAITPENLRLFPRQGASPAAVTRVFRDGRGHITEADIVLNPFVRFSTDGSFDTFDLQDTLTHEIGHLLGLEHTPVWGSIMYERAARSLGPSSFKGSRDELPQVDSSAIRALYGPPLDDVKCCGVVSGKVSGDLPNARVLLWIENAETGQLIAATVPDRDGTYRLDGVPEGNFLMFASSETQSDEFASDSSKIAVAVADSTKKNFVLRSGKSGVRVQFLGSSFHLAGLPVDLAPISQEIFFGVNGVPKNIARVGVSGGSILFEQKPNSNNLPLFSSVKVLGIGLTIPPDLPKGEYTLIIEASTGVKQYLVGALVNR